MRILMISALYRPGVGGVESHIESLAQAIANVGHEVAVLHNTNRVPEGDENSVDVRVYRFRRPSWEGAIEGRSAFRRVLQSASWRLNAAEIERIISDFNPDVIHQHDFVQSAMLTKYLSRRYPVVWTNHMGEPLILNRYAAGRAVLRWLVNHYSVVIAPSHELLNSVDVPANRRFFIPNGVSMPDWTRPTSWPDDPFLIVCPRRMAPTKGVAMFVESLEWIESKRIMVAITGDDSNGYPEYVKHVHKLAERSGHKERIRFMGSLTRTRTHELISRAHLVVIPSVLEATSIAALEAMSYGVPVLATAVGGNTQIIKHGETGLLVRPGSSEAFGTMLNQAVNGSYDLVALGQHAREEVETHYTWDAIAAQTLGVYRSLW